MNIMPLLAVLHLVVFVDVILFELVEPSGPGFFAEGRGVVLLLLLQSGNAFKLLEHAHAHMPWEAQSTSLLGLHLIGSLFLFDLLQPLNFPILCRQVLLNHALRHIKELSRCLPVAFWRCRRGALKSWTG